MSAGGKTRERLAQFHDEIKNDYVSKGDTHAGLMSRFAVQLSVVFVPLQVLMA